jgi:hypothetical protein
MKRRWALFALVSVIAVGWWARSHALSTREPSGAKPPKVYGEWRIRVKPDKGADYAKLIQEKGLPLFIEAGGRMVGWWTTLVGDLYEQVTIWEYDGMAGFEKAIGLLGKEPRFAEFVKLRDPLLSGEDARFHRLLDGARAPKQPEGAKFVVREVHRVDNTFFSDYWESVQKALPLAEKAGFRLAGPFQVVIGDRSEITYLWLYDSLVEREAKIAAFLAIGLLQDLRVRRRVERGDGAKAGAFFVRSQAGWDRAKNPSLLVAVPSSGVFESPQIRKRPAGEQGRETLRGALPRGDGRRRHPAAHAGGIRPPRQGEAR